ncbi:unnamed protein product [Darwinula stevensoni]|uniref:Uncharacterized protein n=1 Tax=Darwinula stevensoni TaxID=69355 RepID=A0A7R9A3A8_9CRUS|nr:unnamed protein product [Darwinula stevensoni]CAG0891312.1 unnamed protein product [Darwinula stevensoni]
MQLTPVHTSEPEKTEEMPEKQLGEMTVQERLDRIEKKVDDTQREMKKGLKEILNLLSSG